MRHEEGRWHALLEARILRIARHADHLDCNIAVGAIHKLKMAPDGRSLTKDFSRHRFVDDGHARTTLRVGGRQVPSRDQRYAHGLEEVPPGNLNKCVLWKADTIWLHGFFPFAPRDERHHRHRTRLNTGNGFDGSHDPLVYIKDTRRTVTLQGRINPKHQQVVGVEPDIDLAEIVKGAHQEPGADEEHDADGDLRCEKGLARNPAGNASLLRAGFQ